MVHDEGSPDTRLLLLREDLGTEGGRALARERAAPCLRRQVVLPPIVPRACTKTVQASPSLTNQPQVTRQGRRPPSPVHYTDEAWRPFKRVAIWLGCAVC